jgi:dTDP-4-amino-4,6-dideoxygalactose transaminase
LATEYQEFFASQNIQFVQEPKESKSNYWLQAILLDDLKQRDEFLDYTNSKGVMTRPIWTLMNKLEMFKDCQCADLKNSKYFEERVVNIPSSVRLPI